MRKVFHFDAPREKYRCDAAVVWCFDNRFEQGLKKYLRRIGIENIDPIKVAGGARALASPDHESDREFVLGQIQKSVRLHSPAFVVLMVHSDCGAYGGLDGAFKGDRQAESAHMEGELQRAADVVRRAVPGVQVRTYFVDFEGVWDPAAE